MKHVFLGLDCSTQSLSALLIDYDSKKVIYEKQLIFEKAFPHYGTKSGALRNGNVVHSPPLMWVEALDQLFLEMKKDGAPLKDVLAVAGSAQQHGSVYLNDSFPTALKAFEFKNVFSREIAPIWMDASTTEECEEIRAFLGGALSTIQTTGSNTFERFTGPQIRKFYKKEPEKYANTHSIALVSSFLASLMAGTLAPIDHGDGSGMNLMDIQTKDWSSKALDATAPHLAEKLPPLVPSWEVLGTVNPYFEKYGLNRDALALAWTGDNPSSLIGLGLIQEGMTAVSLGTSFTHFGCLKEFHIDPKGEGHLFVSPTDDYMTLNCFLNGALAIRKTRDMYGLSWDEFNGYLEKTPPGNNGGIILPYFEAEIIPKKLKPHVERFNLEKSDAPANCRAIVEAQMMAMYIHADWMKLKPKEIYATGGVSNNLQILQILADVHNCPVSRSIVPKSTALGAALRAAFGYFSNKSWKEIVKGFTDPIPAVKPNPESVKTYEKLMKQYKIYENQSNS